MQFKPENLTDGQTRLYFIDLLESIAIFLVLAYHGTNYEYSFLEDSGNVLFYLRYYFRTILSCCVPLFFFANGYLLLNRDFNPFRGIYGYAFVYFCIGGITDDIKNKLGFLNKIWVNIAIILMSMLGLFSVGVALSNITNKSWDVVWYGYDTIFTFINVFCIFSLCTKYKGKENLFRKVITLVSTNTLGVYFIYVLFNQLLIPYVREFALMSNILGNVIYTLVILFASLVSVVIIKKIPLLK